MEHASRSSLMLKRMGIDTHQEPIVYMRADCHVCRAEGFSAQSRVRVTTDRGSIIATLNVVRDGFMGTGQAGLSDAAWRLLDAVPGQPATFSHPRPVESLSIVRAKIFGHPFREAQLSAVLQDIAAGRYADIDLSAFLTACAAGGMSHDEVVGLTRGMVEVGERLTWNRALVADKHCVGGLPGNRTTPIIVSIVAAAGVCIPKTSSRAITSPAGTADAMETLAPVDLDLISMRRVVEREGGCVVWGGAMGLSPVDDVLIRVERALDLDSDAQLVASVLSKKVAAGSSHVVIDIPVGTTAKVRTPQAAEILARLLERVGREVGLEVRTIVTDGSQPVGRGIGPALEARDVVAVTRGDRDVPGDLRDRAILLAGETLELAGACSAGEGNRRARTILDNGDAWVKLQAICEAQGGMRTPPIASQRVEVIAQRRGVVTAVDNRRLARAAKLAGAPTAAAAGIDLLVRIGATIEIGQPLFALHADTPGELAYAQEYLDEHAEVVVIGDPE
jgi:thymidine phosphorylase